MKPWISVLATLLAPIVLPVQGPLFADDLNPPP